MHNSVLYGSLINQSLLIYCQLKYSVTSRQRQTLCFIDTHISIDTVYTFVRLTITIHAQTINLSSSFLSLLSIISVKVTPIRCGISFSRESSYLYGAKVTYYRYIINTTMDREMNLMLTLTAIIIMNWRGLNKFRNINQKRRIL